MSLKVTKKTGGHRCGLLLLNLVLSLLLWGAIIIGRDELAVLVGNDGLGIPLIMMGAMIPLSAFSSVQMALYRRDFNFKFLLNIRLITILTPILISIPMALMGVTITGL